MTVLLPLLSGPYGDWPGMLLLLGTFSVTDDLHVFDFLALLYFSEQPSSQIPAVDMLFYLLSVSNLGGPLATIWCNSPCDSRASSGRPRGGRDCVMRYTKDHEQYPLCIPSSLPNPPPGHSDGLPAFPEFNFVIVLLLIFSLDEFHGVNEHPTQFCHITFWSTHKVEL